MMMDLPARESMEFDVVVVGAGPSGLAANLQLGMRIGCQEVSHDVLH